MTDGKGYLIPDDVQPLEMGCILVFYPEDAQNFYLRALVGSLSYLGTWVAWERDTEKRGILAARAWKEANDCTFDSMSCVTDLVTALTGINQTLAAIQAAIEGQEITLDASGLLPALAGIEDAIENISISGGQSEEDMATVINNYGCGCGCGNGSTGPDLTIPESPVTPPTPGPTNENPFASDYQKCALSNYLIYSLRLSLLQSASWGGDYTGFADYLDGLWGAIVDTVSGWVSRLPFASYLFTMQNINGNSGAVTYLSEVFDQYFNDYVCTLFSSGSETAAQAALHEQLGATLGGYPGLAETAQNIAAYLPYSTLFADAGEVEIPAGWGGRACCGQTPVDDTQPDLPPITGNYEWRNPGTMTLGADDYTTGHTIGISGLDVTGYLPGTNTTWDPVLDVPYPALALGESVVGQMFTVTVNNCPGGNDPAGDFARVDNVSTGLFARLEIASTDSGAVSAGEFDSVTTTNPASFNDTGYFDIAFYRRAGVSGDAGSIHVRLENIKYLIKLP